MSTSRLLIALAIAIISLVGCKDDRQAQPVQPRPSPVQPPTTTPPTAIAGWRWVHVTRGSGGPLTQDGEWTTFRFDGTEPHMLLRNTGPLSGTARMTWKCESCTVKPVQGTNATVSFIFVRRGNNWSADGAQVNYRWYHAGRPVTPGETMEIPLQPQHWTNVYGQQNPAGFADAMANAEYIGLAFGDPGAGATAHGVTGTGKFSFTFEVGP